MENTTIAVNTSLDVIDRYRELVEASLDGDSIRKQIQKKGN